MQEMIPSNDLLDDADALKSRMADQGYLLIRNILQSQSVRTLHNDIIDILARKRWIHDGRLLQNALAKRSPVREGEEEAGFFQVYDEVQKLESLYALAQDTLLLNVMRQVLGESAFPHPLSICRLAFPNNDEATTPPHQDYPNNQGSKNLTAAWIPLDDCPRVLGGIAILEGSNRFDEVLPLSYHLGAGRRRAELPARYRQLRWVSTDFKAGDILLFPALTVHRALNNASKKQIRISVDYRYQLEGEHLTETVLHPHFKRFGWREVYENWTSEELKYYWQNKRYVIDEWNPSYHSLPDEHLADAIRREKAYQKARLLRTRE